MDHIKTLLYWLSIIIIPVCRISALSDYYDIIVYGGTPAGIIASIQAAKMGKTVLLIEPGSHLGGMMSSGLGWVDIGNPNVIGGLSHDYFHLIWSYYEKSEAWIWEKKHEINGQRQHPPKDQTLWVVEPHVAEQIFYTLLKENSVTLVTNERLKRSDGVQKTDAYIMQITMESGRIFQGLMFIDATYEGDLMAAAGVSYTIGRESNSLYGETLNGIHPNIRLGNKYYIDPYFIKGDPKSGLLPRIYPLIGKEGEGDAGIQAYNYRICLTDIPANRICIEKPTNYKEIDYEILFRAIEANKNNHFFLTLDLIPNRKTDSNNKGLISTDYIGMSWNYPEVDYDTRQKIAEAHENWQRGLIWTIQNHPRVPQTIRNYYAPWGLAKDEFVDNNHWPFQLYIREARRMIGEEVITEHTVVENTSVIEDPIGLGSYAIDSHAIKYCVGPNKFLITDGGLFKSVKKPCYAISYCAIIPQRKECKNLLVPICLSATHVAYDSIRIEPVFMILGQSAATAAALAINLKVALQDLPYSVLEQQLLKDKQILNYPN